MPVAAAENLNKCEECMMKRLAVVCTFAVLTWSPAWAQTSPTNEDLLKEIKAIRQELQEIKKLIGQPRPAADALPKNPINISKEPVKGDGNARVALIEFSDYQCPFCSRFGKDTYPQLETDYIKTGKLKYVFRDLPLDFHKQAFKAAEAAHCAGEQGKFWEMHDQLFANNKALAPEDLTKYAGTLQLNTTLFQQCLDSARYAADIKKDIAEANSAGITGTPTFLLGTINTRDGTVKVTQKLVGAKPYAEFKAAIDSLLASPQ
jgi:protein-disulfide isomerase